MNDENIRNRFLYIDNLKLLMIILVVLVHCAVTYSGLGSWYFMDSENMDNISYVFFGLFQSYTQAYFMGFLFLISGLFVAKSYDKKGCKRFIKDRLLRLGIPALFYMLVIHPFNVYVLLSNTWEKPAFFRYYGNYLISFDFLGCSGPLWFALALLIFDCFYVAYRKLTGTRSIPKEKKLPGIGFVWLLIALITVFAFLIRLVWPIGTSLANMQLCFFAEYIILFIAGIRVGRFEWFSQISYRSGKFFLIAAFALGIVFWVVIMLAGGYLQDGFGAYQGGFTWQSAAYAFWEAFLSVFMSIGLIGVFKEKYNKQNILVKTLSDNSFAVYVFHAPIIISISLAMVKFQLHPIIKFLAASILGLSFSFLAAHYIFRRIPLLKRVL